MLICFEFHFLFFMGMFSLFKYIFSCMLVNCLLLLKDNNMNMY